MGKITREKPVKLIIGFIFKDNEAYASAKNKLSLYFGKIDFESAVIPFNLTNYYTGEMGEGLKKIFLSFNKLILPHQISEIKVLTNKIEEKLSLKNKRRVNIDPGYLDLAKLILVSTKDYCHRIYLKKGIFAENTLCYKGKSFTAWPWAYPDYQTPGYIGIFNQIRDIYAGQVKLFKS